MMRWQKMTIRDSRAFTVIEAMVTMLIFSIVVAAAYMTLSDGTVCWGMNNVKVELQQELRKSMERIMGDLRQGGSGETYLVSSVPADGNPRTTLTFRMATGASGNNVTWSNRVQYVLGGPDGKNLLRRVLDGSGNVTEEKVVALAIKTFTVTRASASPALVTVAMTAEKDTTTKKTLNSALNFTVKVRN